MPIKTIGELKKALEILPDEMELFYPVVVSTSLAHMGRYKTYCYSKGTVEYGCCKTTKKSYPNSWPPKRVALVTAK